MLSVVTPTYNEKENIEKLVQKISKTLDKKIKYEIIVVDDNSPDGTGEVVKRLSKKYPVRLVEREGKMGLTTAVLDGVKIAKGNYVCVIDADLSHPPEKIIDLANYMGEADIIIGSRNIPGGGEKNWTKYRKFVAWTAKSMAKIVTGVKVSDPMSGFFIVRTDVIKNTKFSAKGFKILLDIVAKNRSLKVKEVPYMFVDREGGETKFGMGETVRYIKDLIAIRRDSRR